MTSKGSQGLVGGLRINQFQSRLSLITFNLQLRSFLSILLSFIHSAKVEPILQHTAAYYLQGGWGGKNISCVVDVVPMKDPW